MTDRLTISAVSRATGISVPAIRFYEAEGVLPAPTRTVSGYRLYSPIDVRRLRLIRRARLLGLSLAAVKTLVERAFASECADFAAQLLEFITTQRADIDQRIAELESLRSELGQLEEHVRDELGNCSPGQLVAECSACPMIDERGGET